jgi:hypothetical protein
LNIEQNVPIEKVFQFFQKNSSIEQQPTCAALHDQVDVAVVLEGAQQLHCAREPAAKLSVSRRADVAIPPSSCAMQQDRRHHSNLARLPNLGAKQLTAGAPAGG